MFGKGVSIRIGAVLSGWQAAIGTVTRDLAKIGSATKDLQNSFFELGQAAATLWSVGRLVKGAGDLEHGLLAAAITADLTDQQVEELRHHLLGLAVPDKTNKSVQELLGGFTALVSAGLDAEKAKDSLYAIGRAATASGATVEDLSKTAFVLIDTLGVTPGSLVKELDRLAYAGKQGAFELKDMARYFPTLGASVKFLGLQGTEAVATLSSALQIAKLGAADPGEAANNLRNFLDKLASPETIKRFEEHGVSLKNVLTRAMKKGENPFEAVVETIDQMLGADPTKRQFRLGALFQDVQVQAFLRPMLSNMEKYWQLKKGTFEAAGVVDQDYARMLNTFKERWQGLAIAIGKVGEAIGKSLLPPLGAVVAALTPVIGAMASLTGNAPVTTVAITALGGAILVLPAALKLASVAMTVFGIVARSALLSNPIGLALTGIALGVTLLIDLWPRLSTAFAPAINYLSDHWRGFAMLVPAVGLAVVALIDNWDALKSAVGSAIDWMGGRISWFMPLIEGVGAAVETVVNFIAGKFTWIAPLLEKLGAAWEKLSTEPMKIEWLQQGASSSKPGAALALAQGRGNDLLNPANENRPGISALAARGLGGANGRVAVHVDFANMPKGAAARVESQGDDLDMTARTGYALGAFG